MHSWFHSIIQTSFNSRLNEWNNDCLTGFSCSEQSNSFLSGTQQTSLSKNDFSAPNFRLTVSSTPKKEASDRSKVFATHIQPTTLSPSVGKQSCSQNGTDSSGEAQMRNVRSRGDGGGKHHLLPRYWPRITDQELQQISGEYPIRRAGLPFKILWCPYWNIIVLRLFSWHCHELLECKSAFFPWP